MLTMEQKLIRLAKLGCYPVITRRGNLWRAHINAGGNQWDEHSTPSLALDAAIHQWEWAGRPMDGLADRGTTSCQKEPLLLSENGCAHDFYYDHAEMQLRCAKCGHEPNDPSVCVEATRRASEPKGIWWCNTHNREATHIDAHRKRCCDPNLGGILLPCHVVFDPNGLDCS